MPVPRVGTIPKRGRGRPAKNAGTSSTSNANSKVEQLPSKVKPKSDSSGNRDVKAPANNRKNPLPPSKRSKRKAQDAGVDELGDAEPSAHPRKRNTNRAKPDEHGENASKAITTKEYTHLVPRTKRIRQEVLEGWEDASSTLLEQINFLLKNAKDDIVYTRRDARRAEHANAILLSATQRLERSLLHMKIPPTARPLHFNLDRLAERNEQVYREVVASRHSKLLLEEQIEMAQRLLEEDQKKLRQLEKNAQDWRGRWQSREKKQLHPLLRQPEDVEAVGDTADNIGLRVVSTPIDKPVLDTPDSDLVPLLEQLRRSLEAMQGNHTQVQGISEAMRDARAALDDVLFRHASARQYDGV